MPSPASAAGAMGTANGDNNDTIRNIPVYTNNPPRVDRSEGNINLGNA